MLHLQQYSCRNHSNNLLGEKLLKNNNILILLSSLYVCMAIKYIIVLFVETPRKFITAKQTNNYSIYYCKFISTDEDPGLLIKIFTTVTDYICKETNIIK